jgi:hypothetical protein
MRALPFSSKKFIIIHQKKKKKNSEKFLPDTKLIGSVLTTLAHKQQKSSKG